MATARPLPGYTHPPPSETLLRHYCTCHAVSTFRQLHAAPCAAAASIARRSTPASSAISWCVRTTRSLSKSSRSPAPPAPPAAAAVALAPPPLAPAGVLTAALSYSASPLSISSYTYRRVLASHTARWTLVVQGCSEAKRDRKENTGARRTWGNARALTVAAVPQPWHTTGGV